MSGVCRLWRAGEGEGIGAHLIAELETVAYELALLGRVDGDCARQRSTDEPERSKRRKEHGKVSVSGWKSAARSAPMG